MPGGDRTGPMGRGPMTGGGFGLCGGSAAASSANRPIGGGRFRGSRGGGGRGRGRGWRNRFLAATPPDGMWADPGDTDATTANGESGLTDRQQELEQLKQQAQAAADTLEDIRERISQLEDGAGR